MEQRAYPIRIGPPFSRVTAAASSTRAGPACQARPGPRSAGTGTASSSRNDGTSMNRAVWYLAAVVPDRVRHGLPAGAWHCGHSCRSTDAAAAAVEGVGVSLTPAILAQLPCTTSGL